MPRRIFSILTTAMFVGFLSAPLAASLTGLRRSSTLDERRDKAPRPKFRNETLPSYVRKFEAFFADHFQFRDRLIQGAALANYVLNVRTEKVVRGSEGWMYYDLPDNLSTMDDFMGRGQAADDTKAQWIAALEGRRAWLAERGVKYLFVVAPNKEAIHPEHLPSWIRERRGATRKDQILLHLSRNCNCDVLDLESAVLAAKETEAPFCRADTHWNGWGRYVAYREVILRLSQWFPELRPVDLGSELELIRRPDHAADLFASLGLAGVVAAPHEPFLFNRRCTNRPAKFEWRRPVAIDKPGAKIRAVYLVDSFFKMGGMENPEAPPEGLHFERFVMVAEKSGRFEPLKELVEREKPDVVIETRVARSIRAPLSDHPELAAARARSEVQLARDKKRADPVR